MAKRKKQRVHNVPANHVPSVEAEEMPAFMPGGYDEGEARMDAAEARFVELMNRKWGEKP